MSLPRLIAASLRHHRRAHLGVLLGAAVASAVLVGALAVGDSVRHTLAREAAARLGSAGAMLGAGDRLFRAELAQEIAQETSPAGATVAAPLVVLPAVASTAEGDRRVLDARVHGVDARFFALAPGPLASPVSPPAPREAFLSRALARELAAEPGDAIVLRVERPSAVPKDLALSPDDDTSALRVTVARVLSDAELGSFALDMSPRPPANAFVDLAWMQGALEIDGRANAILFGGGPERARPGELTNALSSGWRLDDAEIETRTLASGRRELTSRRIFFDVPVVEALDALDVAPLTGVFTYFVNAIERGEHATPYSMVAGIGPLGAAAGSEDPLLSLTRGLEASEARLNEWTLADTGAAAGDVLTLDYYVVDASRRLVTRRHDVAMAGSLPALEGQPIEGTEAGRELMPDFPGIADADHCREWEPGTPIDMEAIRDVDEEYWDLYRGTPKAYVSLATARELWSSRFGALTGVRFAASDEEAVLGALRDAVGPASVGLFVRDLATGAARAADSPTDFGTLFLALSFFLIAAALLLIAQLFHFGVEARASELGLYAALGFTRRRIAAVLLAETGVVALAGVAAGIPLGLGYTRAVLLGLETLWADAVARTPISFHAEAATIAAGAAGAFAATLATVALGIRRALRSSARAMLSSRQGVLEPAGEVRRGPTLAAATVLGAGALLAVFLVDPAAGPAAAGAFFGAGAAVLAAGLILARWRLRRVRTGERPLTDLRVLGATNAKRRPGRSLGTVASTAIGTFLVLAVGVHRLGPVDDPYDRASGTGGFAFYGRSSLSLLHDVATSEGRAALALDDADLAGVSLVRMRVRDGDDASCLSLARPSAPRLLGVDPSELDSRGAFSFASAIRPTDAPWKLLDEALADGAVPAIGDEKSLRWQLKLDVGDELEYLDERGRPFRVRIVAALADTILQGDLVVAERELEARYPSQGGYRRFLVDAPPERADEVRATLTRRMSDIGLALEPTGERLDAFHAVQNTYLSIFQALGALGLLLGSIGLGLVVLRNTIERRGELAALSALGFAGSRVRRVVMSEYGALLAAGLAIGALAAALSFAPGLAIEGSGAPLGWALALIALIGANGMLWIALAVAAVTGRDVAAALRAE